MNVMTTLKGIVVCVLLAGMNCFVIGQDYVQIPYDMYSVQSGGSRNLVSHVERREPVRGAQVSSSVNFNGLYGTCSDSRLPGTLALYGALLGYGVNVTPGNSKVFHSFSILTGIVTSECMTLSSETNTMEHSGSVDEYRYTDSLKMDHAVPLMAGYTLHFPFHKVYGFVGMKAGVWLYKLKYGYSESLYHDNNVEWAYDDEDKDDEAKFACSATIGLRIPVNNDTDITVSYELFKIKGLDAVNTFQLGVSFTF